MAYDQKPGQGTVWKESPDKRAAYSGRLILPDGQHAYIDLYLAKRADGTPVLDKAGEQFFNVSVKVKPTQPGERNDAPPSPAGGLEDDDLPPW
jgi:hypothetical protein